MDAESLDSSLKYINLNGVTLNLEERLHIKLSLSQLANDLHLDQVFFWGKITGNPLELTPYRNR